MESRGTQSWGWTDGEIIHKEVGLITHGLSQERFYTSPISLIHTRHATQGAITAENSHPYRIGDIIGMHNGMLDNHRELNIKYNRDCAVDSQHIFHHIHEGRSLKDIYGYGTIVFTRGGRVFVGHFEGGELAIARSDEGFGYLFASTSIALESAIAMAGFDRSLWTFYDTKDGDLHEMHPDGLRIVGKLDVSPMWSGNTWEGGWSTKGSPKDKGKDGSLQRQIDAILDGTSGDEDEDEYTAICDYCGIECDSDDVMFELASGDKFVCENCTLWAGLDVPYSDVHRHLHEDGAECAMCGVNETDLFSVYDDTTELCIGCLVDMYHSQELLASHERPMQVESTHIVQ
jgi:hypothetical protein